ncbi:MAG: acyl-CoA dehydrogenase [Halieaceae bacterium]|jgi:acyl-CoA dehydrogenase|nr:acyl-CoA dehydrogenase [Halieaceae bacterium]
MVDFTVSEIDQQILDQIRAEGKAGEKYTRYYEDNEEELLKDEFPEAKNFPPLIEKFARRTESDTSGATLGMQITMRRAANAGVPLKQSPGQGLGNAALAAAGTEEQKRKWSGLTLAMSITEPGAGSDTKAIQTTATRDGDDYILNGDKIFVTTGIRCEGVVVWATVDKSLGRAGIKSFMVMKGTPGFEIVRKEKKLGIRTSDTAAFSFRDCRVPRENVLGGDEEKGKGAGSGAYKGVLKTFNMTRPGVAAGGIGQAIGAFEFARDALAAEGVEVDWDMAGHNRTAAQQTLIDMEADIEAASLVTFRAAWLADQGASNNLEASVSKSKGGDVCRTVPQRAMELLGGMSISHDHLLEKYLRDGRISDIYEGTGQIQRLIIARTILGLSSAELS